MGHLGTDDGCQAERGEEASRCGGARRSTQVSGKGRAVVPDEFFVHTDLRGRRAVRGDRELGRRRRRESGGGGLTGRSGATSLPAGRPITARGRRQRLPGRRGSGIPPWRGCRRASLRSVSSFFFVSWFFLEFFCQLVDGGEAKKGLKAC